MYKVDNDAMFAMKLTMKRCLQMFAIATFHVNRPRFDGGVDKRVFVHLEMNAIVKPMLGKLIEAKMNRKVK